MLVCVLFRETEKLFVKERKSKTVRERKRKDREMKTDRQTEKGESKCKFVLS
jgi:hypothetical protein